MKSTGKNLWAAVFLLAGLTALAWGLYPLLTPPGTFTRIKVSRDVASPDGRKISIATDSDLASEVEFIRSEAILSKAIRDLNLESDWSTRAPGEALSRLQQRVEVRRFRKTFLVDIRVAGENPEEAARIADGIADAYRAYRHDQPKETVSQAISGSMDTLQEELNRLGQQIYDTRVSMEKLRRDAGVSESIPPGRISDPEMQKTYEQLDQKLAELTSQRMAAEEAFTDNKPRADKRTSVVSVEILRRASSQPPPGSSRHMGSMTLILVGVALCGAGAILLIPFRKLLSPLPPPRAR